MVPPSPPYVATPDEELEAPLPLLEVLLDVVRPLDEEPAPLELELAPPVDDDAALPPADVPPEVPLLEDVPSGGMLHAVVLPNTVARIADQRAIGVMSKQMSRARLRDPLPTRIGGACPHPLSPYGGRKPKERGREIKMAGGGHLIEMKVKDGEKP
jgi:hypothetical protein